MIPKNNKQMTYDIDTLISYFEKRLEQLQFIHKNEAS